MGRKCAAVFLCCWVVLEARPLTKVHRLALFMMNESPTARIPVEARLYRDGSAGCRLHEKSLSKSIETQ